MTKYFILLYAEVLEGVTIHHIKRLQFLQKLLPSGLQKVLFRQQKSLIFNESCIH
jgi:hypothetical protein